MISFSTTRREGHDAYLDALNRAVTVGIALSLAVHAVLVGLLPNPFHHYHPGLPDLRVDLVTVPPTAQSAALEEQKAAVEPPTPLPLTPEATPKPKPVTRAKLIRVQPAPEAARKVDETRRLLPHAEPAGADTAEHAATEAAASEEKSAPTGAAEPKDITAEVDRETPPSFRAAYLRNPEPAYPSASRRLGEQGTVRLRVLVSADGQAARVEINRSSGFPRLDEAAATAVREWRFVPAKRGSTPVEAPVIVPIVFRLEAE